MCIAKAIFKLPRYSKVSEWSMSYHSQTIEIEQTQLVPNDNNFLGLYFNLGCEQWYKVPGFKSGTFYKDHFNLVYLPDRSCELTVAKGQYSSLCIRFSLGYLSQFANNFPLLTEFLKSVHANTPASLSHINLIGMPETLDKVREILDGNQEFDDAQGEIRLQSKMMTILVTCLEHIHHQLKIKVLHVDIAKIKKAHDYLINNLSVAHSVTWLADMVDMDVRKFEKAFKIIHGKTVYQFLIDTRLRKAVDLLKDTELLTKEVAQCVGYKAVKKFSEAFKKKFGYPPSSVRKWGTINPSDVKSL